MTRTTILLLVTLILAVPAGASNRMLTTEFAVDAPTEKAWTTPDGIRTFFAPDCKVELPVDGACEIYFSPQARPASLRRDGFRPTPL